MKKQVLAAVAIAVSMFSFAQKKELKAAEKAVKSTNFSEAKTILGSIDANALDDKTKAKYNYVKGLALYANGAGTKKELQQGVKLLNKSRKSFKVEVDAFKKEMLGTVVAKANKSYEDKEFAPASDYFERAYDLKKKDTFYLFYAAASSINVPDYDRALTLYEKLKDLKYTGIETKYYATEVVNGGKVEFPNEKAQKAAVGRKTHIKPTSEVVPSKRAEIVKNVALIHITQGNDEKAIKAIEDARAEAPNDVSLIISQANIYYKLGDTEKFKETLSSALEKDPNNSELLYNLGVVSSESKQFEDAKKYYQKAIDINPKYVNAYINMAVVVLGEEEAIINEMNNLGTSSADNKRYDVLLAKRKGLYKEAIPFLEKALEINPKSLNAATTLMNIYGALGETTKQKEMKAKVEALSAG